MWTFNRKKDSGIINSEPIGRNAKRFEIFSQKVFTMALEDAIINLVDDGLVQHKQEKLLLYCDLGFTVKNNKIDLNRVIGNLKGQSQVRILSIR